MYALLCERVCHPDNDTGNWLPSRCLAKDGRSDSDIPAFSGTPQYFGYGKTSLSQKFFKIH
jgi:hypothetical protein